MKQAHPPAPEDREPPYPRLGRWLRELGSQSGPILWVDPAAAAQAPLERWLLANAGICVSSRIRLRSRTRLSQEWLAQARLPVPEALDHSSWRVISLALAAEGPGSVPVAADLVWYAHEASLGAPAAGWLQELAEPWRTSALQLEQAAVEHLARLKMPPDLHRLGRDALIAMERNQHGRLLLLDDASAGQQAMVQAAVRANMETVTLPLHLAASELTGTPTAGEHLADQLRSGHPSGPPDHLSLLAADDVGTEAQLVAATVQRAVRAGIDPERIVVAVGLASQLPAMARALTAAGLRPLCRHGQRPNWAGERWLSAVAGLIHEPTRVDAWQGLTDSGLAPADVPAPTGSRLLRRLTLGGWLRSPPASLSDLLTWPAEATVEQHMERLFSVFGDANLVDHVEALGTEAVSALNHHLALLRQLAQVARTHLVSRQRWADMLRESLPALALADGPGGRHQVQLVTLSQAVGLPSDLLWLSGLVAGTLPAATDRQLPVATDGFWRPWLAEQQGREKALVDRLLAAATGEVWASYPRRDADGTQCTPALWVEGLRQQGVAVTETSTLGWAATVSSVQQVGRIMALQGGGPERSKSGPDLDGVPAMPGVAEWGLSLGPQVSTGHEDLTADLAQRVFGGSFSVTDLEERAKCPTRHLVRTLGWQEPADGMDARAWGIVMHGLLAKAASSATMDWAAEVASALDTLAVPELTDPAERAHWQCRITEVISALAPQIRRELERSQCDASTQEIAFGADQESGGISLTLADGRAVSVRGRIDRLDRFGDFTRVVDYKSAAVSALRAGRWTRLRAQVDLQLLAYGLAVRQQGLTPLALEYVSLATPWSNDPDAGEVRETLSRIGLYAAHPGLEAVLGSHEGQELVKTDGTVSQRGGALAPDQLARLIDLTALRLRALAADARSGVSAPDPIRLGRTLTCASCPLQPICRYEGTGERQVPSVTRAEFVSWIDA
ncbi:MAG: PD-(D/E)XK nuclease family protein [Sulfobacillus sp.]